jgi:hypothetical protein
MHLYSCIWVVLLISRLNLALLSPKLSHGIDIVLVYLCPCGFDNPRNKHRWKLLQLTTVCLRIILFDLRTTNRRHGWLGSMGRKGNEVMGGAHESAIGERRGGLVKCATPRRECIPAIMPRRCGPTRPVKEAMASWGRAGWHGWTGPAGLDTRGDSNGNLIFEFQGFLEFGKNLRNSTRRFRRNLGMGIFPKFF